MSKAASASRKDTSSNKGIQSKNDTERRGSREGGNSLKPLEKRKTVESRRSNRPKIRRERENYSFLSTENRRDLHAKKNGLDLNKGLTRKPLGRSETHWYPAISSLTKRERCPLRKKKAAEAERI